jgi:hypothetical protein
MAMWSIESRNQARHAAVVRQLLDAGRAYRRYAQP